MSKRRLLGYDLGTHFTGQELTLDQCLLVGGGADGVTVPSGSPYECTYSVGCFIDQNWDLVSAGAPEPPEPIEYYDPNTWEIGYSYDGNTGPTDGWQYADGGNGGYYGDGYGGGWYGDSYA